MLLIALYLGTTEVALQKTDLNVKQMSMIEQFRNTIGLNNDCQLYLN
ncbi:hypothetical protein [Psychromonas ingrahamii]|nr:hypothetical protein [Psychromonas ingrahamii]